MRMAELVPEIATSTIENTMLEHVRRCDPLKNPLHLMELSKLLPSIQDVNLSYIKLRKLCIPENDREFMVSNSPIMMKHKSGTISIVFLSATRCQISFIAR